MKEENKQAFEKISSEINRLTMNYQQHFTQQNVETLTRLDKAIGEFKSVIEKCEDRKAAADEKAAQREALQNPKPAEKVKSKKKVY